MRRTLSRDTSLEAEAVQMRVYRAMPPWRKWELAVESCETTRHLMLAGLRQRHPHDTEARLKRRVARLWLGEELALRVYGPDNALQDSRP